MTTNMRIGREGISGKYIFEIDTYRYRVSIPLFCIRNIGNIRIADSRRFAVHVYNLAHVC